MITVVLALTPAPAMAAGVLGEYSFLHVTFKSVWYLFIFIFALVMIPFVLIIFTSWRFRDLKEDETPGDAAGKTTSREEQEE
ncbi:MAG: hypothetical protein Q9M27_03165 [Mariprofundaceae bacterium]|nr:hypothetical protein [Mariprofundaceae bacterium]